MRYSRRLRKRILKGDYPAWLVRHPRQKYIVNVILSEPPWSDRKVLLRIYREAQRRNSIHKRQRWVVDHIVPVTHELVCGLTVPWNLRIIPASENAARGNRWWMFTEDMFNFSEQLRLL
jgi:hypothetical protein